MGKFGGNRPRHRHARRPDADDTDAHKFVVLPRRWIVERTFAWTSRYRRLMPARSFAVGSGVVGRALTRHPSRSSDAHRLARFDPFNAAQDPPCSLSNLPYPSAEGRIPRTCDASHIRTRVICSLSAAKGRRY